MKTMSEKTAEFEKDLQVYKSAGFDEDLQRCRF